MLHSPSEPSPSTDAAVLFARHGLWRAGDLSWKLDDTQLGLYERIKAEPSALFATEGARKLGKSYAHGVIALEAAQQNPGCQVNWVAITGKEARLVLLPILEQISADAPDDCKGSYNHENGQWRLPNGAWVQLIGAETRKDCEKGRGPSAILNIVDEAGFHEHLEYLVDSILSPQMRRVRRQVGTFVGMTLLVSTTPYTPAHPFCAMADAASVRGAYVRLTIWDSGFESKEDIERYISSQAAKKNLPIEQFERTTHFRREYLSERVVDEEIVVFVEFHSKQHDIVREHPRPIGFEQYIYKRVSLDQGGTVDKWGFLYGYVDFIAARIVIEDECILTKPNTAQVAKEFDLHERELWPDANPQRISRVVDDPTERLVVDLWDLHRLPATRATKHDRDASINLIRSYIGSEKLVIHPRCTQLRTQLLTAIRNKRGTDFEKTPDGHFDLCASLMYFCRDLSLVTNPYPSDFDLLTGRTLPPEHPRKAREELAGKGQHTYGLRGALLAGNPFVQGQLRRRR